MQVYVLEHDDRMYEMGDKYVRGVFASEAAALAALPEKTKSAGQYWTSRHDKNCCGVDEWAVQEAAVSVNKGG